MRLKNKRILKLSQESYFVIFPAIFLISIIDNKVIQQAHSLFSFFNFNFDSVFLFLIVLLSAAMMIAFISIGIITQTPKEAQDWAKIYFVSIGIFLYVIIGISSGYHGITVDTEKILNIGYDEPYFSTLWRNMTTASGPASVIGIVLSFMLALQSVLTLGNLFSRSTEIDSSDLNRRAERSVIIAASVLCLSLILFGKFILNYYWLLNLASALAITNIFIELILWRKKVFFHLKKTEAQRLS